MRIVGRTYCIICIVVLCSVVGSYAAEQQLGRKTVEIPKDFKSVKFSHDGRRVAFAASDGKQYRAIVDGKPEQLYEDVTVVEFSPQGDHYYYGGQRDGQWYLVRDGKEVTKLGSLTSLNQGAGFSIFGEGTSFTIWSTLAIWFAEQADNYFVLAYQGDTGKVFKDGAWLPLEYRSFYHEGMAVGPGGKNYVISVAPRGSRQAQVYLNGQPISQFESVENAAFLQPGDQLIYNGGGRMMLKDKPFPGVGPLAGMIVTSSDGKHFAALVKTGDGKQAVVVDGKQETTYPKVDWGYRGFLSSPGSFAWSKDGKEYAYVVNVASEKKSPQAVVHNGKSLNPFAEIQGSSLVLTPDGKHVAYAAKGEQGWAVVIDNTAEVGGFEEIGNILFTGAVAKVAYTAKTAKGWSLYGARQAGPFDATAGLVSDASGVHLAYAGKTPDGKWQVYRDGKPIFSPCDGIIANTGIRVSNSGDVSFIAKMGQQLVWITSEAR